MGINTAGKEINGIRYQSTRAFFWLSQNVLYRLNKEVVFFVDLRFTSLIAIVAMSIVLKLFKNIKDLFIF